MEICGTHTMAIAVHGLRALLPESLVLLSGPGCPVCVTDQSYIDRSVALARGAGMPAGAAPVIATYGDMVRVPGGGGSLADARAAGAEVRVVYSSDHAVELARARADRQVVFLAVGFETTAPGTALAVKRARELGLDNFSVLTAHKLILPAMRALLTHQGGAAPPAKVDGFLCPGHVSVILGYEAYGRIARQFNRPCVVAGFDPGQVLAGIAEIVRQLADGAPAACTVYPSVSAAGNALALRLLEEVFQPADAAWRGLGVIPASGLELREEFVEFDAARRFELPTSGQTTAVAEELAACRCGDVLRGLISPEHCALFGRKCTPRDPVGPCMVSSEGACAAAYKYGPRRARKGASEAN